MAIDANILLQGQSPDIVNALLSGYQAGNAIQQQPAMNQMFQEKLKMLQGQNQAQQMELTQEQAKFQLGDMAQDAMMIKPMIESGDLMRTNVALAERIKKIQDRGGDPSDTIALRERLNSGDVRGALGELDNVINVATKFGVLGSVDGMFAPTPALDMQGNPVFVQGSKQGGLTQIPGYRPYTPTIQEKVGAEVDAYGKKAQIDVNKEEQTADITTQQAIDEQTGKGVNERQMTYIEQGIAAAEQLPTYDRMSALLDNVSAGKASNIAQSALNVFGQASADYQELDSLMKQAILANIRAFGANPTEGERKFLLESTGDIRQSKETLRRMIDKYKSKAILARGRGERLAQQRGDNDALDLIRGVDKPNGPTPPPPAGAPSVIEVDF